MLFIRFTSGPFSFSYGLFLRRCLPPFLDAWRRVIWEARGCAKKSCGSGFCATFFDIISSPRIAWFRGGGHHDIPLHGVRDKICRKDNGGGSPGRACSVPCCLPAMLCQRRSLQNYIIFFNMFGVYRQNDMDGSLMPRKPSEVM